MAKKTAVPAETSVETIRVNVSRIDAETGEPFFAATARGKEVARLWGDFWIEVPATMAAAEVLCAGASTTFQTPDGEVKLTGPIAPLARKYYADLLEPQRGALRDKALEGVEVTGEEFQALLDAAQPYTGRGGGFKRPVVDGEKLAELHDNPDALVAYLTKMGVVIS